MTWLSDRSRARYRLRRTPALSIAQARHRLSSALWCRPDLPTPPGPAPKGPGLAGSESASRRQPGHFRRQLEETSDRRLHASIALLRQDNQFLFCESNRSVSDVTFASCYMPAGNAPASAVEPGIGTAWTFIPSATDV